MSIFKFTPDFMSSRQLDAITVGRKGLLSYSTEKIRNAVRDGRTANMIFVGPRGIGKSHTVLQLASELEREGVATPARLSEEEYSISSLEDFFSRVLDALGEPQNPDTVDHAREVFKRYRKQGRPVIILVENLQMVFPEMDRDLPGLRSIILEDQSFFIMGTALSEFDQITSPSAAFYNFFEISRLKGLSSREIGELVRLRIGNGRGEILQDPGVANADGLRILTGGNPRLVHMLCDIITQSKSHNGLEKNLMEMLDRLTPFYQARMETMPFEKRRVFDTLALSDGPSTPTEIASKLKSKNTMVTAHLIRLRNDGVVERIKLRQKKETRYQVSDRLYRVWREFRTRGGRAKAIAFVRFLGLWYSHDGLIREYNKESEAFESELPSDMDGARSRLYAMRCLLNAMPDGSAFLEDTVAKFVDAGDYGDAESTIREFRDKTQGRPRSLLSTCNEIVAKKAELYTMPHHAHQSQIRGIFEAIKKANGMIGEPADPRNSETMHAVANIIQFAIDLNNLDLARDTNNRAHAYFQECKKCMRFTHHEISIMIARRAYDDALKAINEALGSRQDFGLISRRTIVHVRMKNKVQAMQDVQTLLESGDFLYSVFYAYLRFLMLEELRELLRTEIPKIQAMGKKERDYMVGDLLTGITATLHGRALQAQDFEILTECIRILKPFITYKIVSSETTGFLIAHGHGVERVGRTLDVLFKTLDRDQLGMLTILKCAVDYIIASDTDSLERLHPEQRELALEMISKISPDTRIAQDVLDSV